ncbi:hypothetical protein JAAARDRAFT_33998 [Jaapia argillacea MUCL 33604]|uniref:Enoyl reductase (ER) domain-containing protein n=1 Tax=Jaapia argillacea MUCL 33604 TaxID=933084 RepID=A0A067PX23_9AGAM|nr:hypothetical protein JAAARDRAFT_33998 [Jaapia argillacea MUCL 33604]
MSAPTEFTRVFLHERPETDFTPTTFKSERLSLETLKPGNGEILVKINWLSLDPAMRGYVKDQRSYLPPVKIGETMRGMCLGTVVEAGSESVFKKGDFVTGVFGWTEYAVAKDKEATKIQIPKGAQLIDFLGPLGTSGLTAYFGLKDIGHLKAGETLVVSGAAGSVGSIACQLGKKAGARVIAIAGSADKCAFLEKELGVDVALNYKDSDFYQKVKKEVGYLDVYFDNVGGDMLDFMLTRLNKNARIVLCGAISDYNAAKPKGLSSYLTLISQRAKIEGFIVLDYKEQWASAIVEMSKWLEDGSLKRKFHIVEGLESAPSALPMLFTGGNTGKLVVKVAEVPTAKL